jgi:hypothetical protein
VCTECGSNKHLAALHVDGEQRHGGEQVANKDQSDDGANPRQNKHAGEITTKCTKICGNSPGGKSCSKICLANIYVKPGAHTAILVDRFKFRCMILANLVM